MSDTPQKTAKQFARMICDYLKTMPDYFADDPKDVQAALGLNDADFKLGLDWCVERKLIELDANNKIETDPADITEAVRPFTTATAELAAVKEPAAEAPAAEEPSKTSTAEVAVAGAWS